MPLTYSGADAEKVHLQIQQGIRWNCDRKLDHLKICIKNFGSGVKLKEYILTGLIYPQIGIKVFDRISTSSTDLLNWSKKLYMNCTGSFKKPKSLSPLWMWTLIQPKTDKTKRLMIIIDRVEMTFFMVSKSTPIWKSKCDIICGYDMSSWRHTWPLWHNARCSWWLWINDPQVLPPLYKNHYYTLYKWIE